MPTYLVTFVVANYAAHTASDWFQRVICRSSVTGDLAYALKTVPYVFYEAKSLFRTPYTWPKVMTINIRNQMNALKSSSHSFHGSSRLFYGQYPSLGSLHLSFWDLLG
jgi:hypothetical protein